MLQRGDGVDAGEGRVGGGGGGEGQQGQGPALRRGLEEGRLLVLGHQARPEAGGGELLQGWRSARHSWNNGKSGAELDLTSSTTPRLQIHTVDHTWTANPCDWLPCCHAVLLLVGCPHSLVYLHLPVVKGLIFCISATPHSGTSFPLFHALNAKLK